MIGHFIWVLFNWPNGIVLGNLMASAIWAIVFEWRLRVHHRKIHLSIHGAAIVEDKPTVKGDS